MRREGRVAPTGEPAHILFRLPRSPHCISRRLPARLLRRPWFGVRGRGFSARFRPAPSSSNASKVRRAEASAPTTGAICGKAAPAAFERRPSFSAFFLGVQEKGLAEGMGNLGRGGRGSVGCCAGSSHHKPPPPHQPSPVGSASATPPQGGSNGGHHDFPSGIDRHAAGWRLPTASAVVCWATTRVAPTNATAWTTTRGAHANAAGGRGFSWAGNERHPPFSPFPLRKGGRGDRSPYRNTSPGSVHAAQTTWSLTVSRMKGGCGSVGCCAGSSHHKPPHRISRRLLGNHKGCPYKCNGVDNNEGCPRKCCGVEGAFPRRSPKHFAKKRSKRPLGTTACYHHRCNLRKSSPRGV